MEFITKMEHYDDFICTAGNCQFTCCKGWKIAVDEATYNRWKNDSKMAKSLKKNVLVKKAGGVKQYHINMGRGKCCPHFNEDGLCQVVIDQGDEFLPKICMEFPRLINSFSGGMEYSLSCACPEVVDIVHSIDGKVTFNQNIEQEDNSCLYDVRATLLHILRLDGFSLRDRLLLGFHMLSDLKEQHIISKDVINCYEDENYLKSIAAIWQEISLEHTAPCLERNELLLDITENYRKEENYQQYLEPLAAYAEELNVAWAGERFSTFVQLFEVYGKLMENCLMLKLFSGCVGNGLDDFLMMYQITILEYVMVQHSAFLTWLAKGELTYEDIRSFVVVYTRSIGNNAEGIHEFFEDSFDGADWELGYLLLLLS